MSKPASSTLLTRKVLLRRLGGIFVLALVVGAVSYPPAANWAIDQVNSVLGVGLGKVEKNFVLGLDLQGGTKLDYEADVANIPQAEREASLSGVRDVIERRVNSLGVSEPVVTTAKAGESWRVAVELAGIRDVNQAIKLIGETPILEFKEENHDPARELTAEEKQKIVDTNAKAKQKAEASLAAALKAPQSFEDLVKTDSADEASKSLGGDLGFLKDKPEYADLFAAVKDKKAGTIVPEVLDVQGAYIVAKVEETKDAGQEIHASHILISYAGSASAKPGALPKEEAKKKAEQIRTELTPQNFAAKAMELSDEDGAKTSAGDLGWFGTGVMVPEFEKAAFALKKGEISQVVESPFGFHIIYKSDERPLSDVRVRAIIQPQMTAQSILPAPSPWKSTELTGKQLKRAQLEFDQRSGSAQVSLQFDEEGSKMFAAITKRNLGKSVAIFLDGQPISTPTVQSEITGGQAVITGSFSIPEAKLLAQRLQAGALPVPIKLIAQQSVGPTLGQDSINKSLMAGMWGFVMVAIFMLLVYRAPGLVSVIGLLLYIGVSASIFKLVPVTLTLSGIAGFILSMGIALDANVLVFERLKEELKAGKAYAPALEDAFRRAWTSIRDGNMTTLISCAVLYWFSSSVIKGFALTLAVGILTSLFTSIVIVRTMLRYLATTPLVHKLRWFFLDSSKR